MKVTFQAQGSDISFIAAYAPHSLHDIEMNERFYNQLSDEIVRTRGIYYIGGDFNARIHHVREVDVDVCGPYISGRGLDYLNTMHDKTKESRALFLGFAKLHSLKIMNTLFSKPPDKLITCKCKIHTDVSDTAIETGPPVDAIKYAQIDFWLAGNAWKTRVLNTQNKKDIFFDSDHFVLETHIRIAALICREQDKNKTITNQLRTDGCNTINILTIR